MTYRIRGLDPEPYSHLFGLSDAALAVENVVRVVADSRPGFPCRATLDDAAPGEMLRLVNHVSQEGGPYHARHAIFIAEGVREVADYADEIPPALGRRLLSLRAFDASGMMVDAALAQPGDADPVIRELLGNPAVDRIDAHNAVRGCFAARVERDV